MNRLICALVLLTGIEFVIAGASIGDTAPEAEMRKAVEPELAKLGKIVEVTKLNGQRAEVMGVKVYALYFRAVVTMNSGWRWVYKPAGDGQPRLVPDVGIGSPALKTMWEALDSRRLRAGTTYVATGEVRFRLSNNRWVQDGALLFPISNGICPNSAPSDCVQELQLEESGRPRL